MYIGMCSLNFLNTGIINQQQDLFFISDNRYISLEDRNIIEEDSIL